MKRQLTFSDRADRLADARYEHFKAIREAKEARSTAWRSRYDQPSKHEKRLCGAKTRRGTACIRKALKNGRCPNHGGLSTGPKTEDGKRRALEGARKGALMRWGKWPEQRKLLEGN